MLTDAQWAKVEPLCTGKANNCEPAASNRIFIKTVLWIARTGSPWRNLPRAFGALLVDKAFDADGLVKDLTERGSKVVIPPRSNRKATREYGKEMYKWRHPAENFFCQLKAFKKVAMRAEKTDSSFSTNIYLAATHRLTIISTAPNTW